MPSAVENNMKIALENIFYNGEDVETALQNAEDLCNEELTMSCLLYTSLLKLLGVCKVSRSRFSITPPM